MSELKHGLKGSRAQFYILSFYLYPTISSNKSLSLLTQSWQWLLEETTETGLQPLSHLQPLFSQGNVLPSYSLPPSELPHPPTPAQLSEASSLQGLILCLAHSKCNDFLFLSELYALKLGTARPILRVQSTRRLLGKAGGASSEGQSKMPFRLVERKILRWGDWGQSGVGADNNGASPGPGVVYSLCVPGVVCTWEAIAGGFLQGASQQESFSDFKVGLRYNSEHSLK